MKVTTLGGLRTSAIEERDSELTSGVQRRLHAKLRMEGSQEVDVPASTQMKPQGCMETENK